MTDEADIKGFLAGLARVLETPETSLDCDFHKTPLWGSLTCFAVKLWILEKYGKDLSFGEIDACESVGELAGKVV